MLALSLNGLLRTSPVRQSRMRLGQGATLVGGPVWASSSGRSFRDCAVFRDAAHRLHVPGVRSGTHFDRRATPRFRVIGPPLEPVGRSATRVKMLCVNSDNSSPWQSWQ